MLKVKFKKYLKREIGSKKHLIKRSNDALLQRIAICFNTLLEYNVGVDYYTPIYGNKFNLNNKLRSKTLQILKQEQMIEIKTNKDGKESWQSCWKYNKETKKKEFDSSIIPTPKSYCFTEYGWSLIQNKKFLNEVKSLTSNTETTSKYQSPEELTDEMLKKAAKDNLSLKFKLSKPIDVVTVDYLEAAKQDWHVTEKNYRRKFKEARQVVLNTIQNFNNKLLKVEERMYSALSLCPKELRQYIITSDGQHIDEGFDINSSILTLLGDTLEYYMEQNKIPIPKAFYSEKKKLQKWCFDKKKHIYVRIGEWSKKIYTKDSIKPHVMQVVFSNNEDIQKRDVNNTAKNRIKDFIQHFFPTIWSILIHFKEEINEDYEQELQQYNNYLKQKQFYEIKKQDWIAAGKINELKPLKPKHINKPKQIKSSIWRYFQTIETHIMLKLKHQLETEFNTTAYWIHDCLCFNKQLITDKFKTHIKSTFKSLIGSLNHYQLQSIESIKNQKEIEKYSVLYRDSKTVELVDIDDDTENQGYNMMEKNDDFENGDEKSEFEVLVDEINNLIEINIRKGLKNEAKNI